MSTLFPSLLRGTLEALAFAEAKSDPQNYRIHIPPEIDVKRIRANLGLSQKQFAETYGFRLRTVQEWEQGRMVPSGAARTFLVVLDREPEAVSRAINKESRK